MHVFDLLKQGCIALGAGRGRAAFAAVVGARAQVQHPHDRRRERRARLDLVGVVLLGAGITLVILPLIRAEGAGRSVQWSRVGLGVVLLACFVAWERDYGRRKGTPLVDLRLLHYRPYAIGSVIGVVYFAGYTSLVFVLSLYFQQGLGYSALAAGAAGAPFSIGSSVSAALSGRVTYRFGRPLVVAGILTVVLALVAVGLLIRLDDGAWMWAVLAGPLLIAGAGSGMVIGPNLTLALQHVPPAQGGTAAAVLQTGQRLGSAFGLAVVASSFLGALAISHRDFSLAAERGVFASITYWGPHCWPPSRTCSARPADADGRRPIPKTPAAPSTKHPLSTSDERTEGLRPRGSAKARAPSRVLGIRDLTMNRSVLRWYIWQEHSPFAPQW
ncbi:MFS transporter [Actinomadura nitritigenes]|uniref:MFS transporter n=1 Tax=Actinomadura nitritigenes TaxID=134602 RepID=UPI003D930775